MKKTIVLTLLIMILASSISYAASPWTTETSYDRKAVSKLVFGAKNVLLGWTAVITDPARRKEGENVYSAIGRGIYEGVIYTIGGAIHAVTFPFTTLDVPLLNDGVKL